jgi:hypothetical protein
MRALLNATLKCTARNQQKKENYAGLILAGSNSVVPCRKGLETNGIGAEKNGEIT